MSTSIQHRTELTVHKLFDKFIFQHEFSSFSMNDEEKVTISIQRTTHYEAKTFSFCIETREKMRCKYAWKIEGQKEKKGKKHTVTE